MKREIERLTEERYDKSFKWKNSIHMVLVAGFFKDCKPTKARVEKYLNGLWRPIDKFDSIVFHTKNDDIIKALDQIYKNKTGQTWYIWSSGPTREENQERIRKIVPVGLVKTEEINEALSAISKRLYYDY